jgi:cell division transport system permease protein
MRLTIREVGLGLRRAPLLSALSIVTIAFSLFAFGLFGLVALNVSRALQDVEERVEIRAFIADGTPVEAVSAAAGDIAAFPEVAQVDILSPEQALERARKELTEFKDVFDADFLPASLEVRLKPGFRDPETVRAVAQRLESYRFVDDVRYGEDWVQKLYNIRNIAGAAGVILGIAFAAVAVIIIGSTIRMAVLAREREISIMRLVGATDGFVRRPFLIDGLL